MICFFTVILFTIIAAATVVVCVRVTCAAAHMKVTGAAAHMEVKRQLSKSVLPSTGGPRE